MPKMQSRQVSRDARLARGNGRARQGSRLTMLASETASTLPREGAEQQSSTIASKSVACAASSSSSTQRRQSQDCETLLKMPLVKSGQEKCPCAVSGLSFFLFTQFLCDLLVVSSAAPACRPACPCVSVACVSADKSASDSLLACPCVSAVSP